jgi:hypothetical protein
VPVAEASTEDTDRNEQAQAARDAGDRAAEPPQGEQAANQAEPFKPHD